MRSVAISILSIVLVLTVPSSAVSKSDPLKSIRPLQLMETNEETGENYLSVDCTTWATVIDGASVWISAAHCVKLKDTQPDLQQQYFIDAKPARLRYVNFDNDVAAFIGGPSAAPLPVSTASVRPLQKVWSAGYPGNEGQVVVTGIIMSVRTYTTHVTLYQLPGAPGVSGAPILSDDNAVVGIVQQMPCPYSVGYCSVSAGVPLEGLRVALHIQTIN